MELGVGIGYLTAVVEKEYTCYSQVPFSNYGYGPSTEYVYSTVKCPHLFVKGGMGFDIKVAERFKIKTSVEVRYYAIERDLGRRNSLLDDMSECLNVGVVYGKPNYRFSQLIQIDRPVRLCLILRTVFFFLLLVLNCSIIIL